MTETEWLEGTDPGVMLSHLVETASARKLRLFACASARQLWDVMCDNRSRTSIEVSERFADGRAVEEDRRLAWTDALEAHNDAPWDAMRSTLAASCTVMLNIGVSVANVVRDVTKVVGRLAARDVASKVPREIVRRTREQATLEARSAQCDLLREVFGNPFRTVEIDPTWLVSGHSAVRRIAAVIYEERRWDDLPILADALEEAGCDDEEILRHCREPQLHVPGCWLLDLILGRT